MNVFAQSPLRRTNTLHRCTSNTVYRLASSENSINSRFTKREELVVPFRAEDQSSKSSDVNLVLICSGRKNMKRGGVLRTLHSRFSATLGYNSHQNEIRCFLSMNQRKGWYFAILYSKAPSFLLCTAIIRCSMPRGSPLPFEPKAPVLSYTKQIEKTRPLIFENGRPRGVEIHSSG